jgi:hypothetical protein
MSDPTSDLLQSGGATGTSLTSLKEVFILDGDAKTEIINLLQYTITGFILCLLVLRIYQDYIIPIIHPYEVDYYHADNKDIAIEFFLKTIVSVMVIFFVHRFIQIIPTISGRKMNISVSVLASILMFCIPNMTPLMERVREWGGIFDGSIARPVPKKSSDGQQRVEKLQPLSRSVEMVRPTPSPPQSPPPAQPVHQPQNMGGSYDQSYDQQFEPEPASMGGLGGFSGF